MDSGSDATASDLQAASRGTHERDGDEGTGLAALYLAVLAGLLLSMALLRVRGCTPIRILRRLMPIWPHPVFIGRDGDPPDLRQLSVIRC